MWSFRDGIYKGDILTYSRSLILTATSIDIVNFRVLVDPNSAGLFSRAYSGARPTIRPNRKEMSKPGRLWYTEEN